LRVNDWYFQGWERRLDANGKKRFVYTGEYYSFPGGTKALKKPTAMMAAALVALYLVLAFFPPAGGMWRIAAIPQLLVIIPLIYLGMGAVCLVRAPEKMTYRDYHSSWLRLTKSLWGCVVAFGAMAAVELVFLVLYGGETPILPELIYWLGQLAALALSVCFLRFVKKHPCSQSI
jgi:hypothetical protein